MKRNFGLPPKSGAFEKARDAKPLLTLGVTAIFGVIGAAIAAISFTDARAMLQGLFHGRSLIAAVLAAGFGCWAYIWYAWPRFAAHFSGGDAFSDVLRFYIRAAIGLVVILLIAKFTNLVLGSRASGVLLCVSGGAAAAAAFQTVMAFVPASATQEAK